MRDLDSALRETLEGDPDAFGDVVARFQDMAFGYAYSVLGDFEDARDATQDAFIIAYRSLGDLRERERFAGWFRRIVLTACRSVARTRAPTTPLTDERVAAPEEPARLAERAELRQAVLSAIRSLSPPNRMATILFYINGYSVEEVSDFLRVPAGTVKRRLHDSRRHLKERMIGMMQEGLQSRRLAPDFRHAILERIRHWQRFKGSDEDKAEMVEADPEWMALVEFEIGLEPMSAECAQIRERIASMEPCHEHYVENVEAVVAMIASMKPGPVLDCGHACDGRRRQAKAYARALEQWRDGRAAPAKQSKYQQDVLALLGARTDDKARVVEHLIGKLKDDSYAVYADEDEDFDLVESRIQHLAICNFNWLENLRIVLSEIAAGKRLYEWRVPGGFYAHGGCPDRIPQLKGLMSEVSAWVGGAPPAKGKARGASGVTARLGRATPEKRWLAASLCKHVSAQHARHGGERLLARPSL